MNSFWLKSNPEKEQVMDGVRLAANTLLSMNAQVLMEQSDRAAGEIEGVCYLPREEAERRADCMIVFGGDGTLLRAAHETELPLLGVNFGHLGFMTELEKGETELFSALPEGRFHIERRMMLRCVKTDANGTESDPFCALNDVVVTRNSDASVMKIDLKINGAYADTYLADGLIVSTPTGSTAYALSAGGAILEPDVEAIGIVPVCPHMLRARPLVVSASRTVTLIPQSRETAHVVADGIALCDLACGEELTVSRAEKEVGLIRIHHRSFYDVLHEKLHR